MNYIIVGTIIGLVICGVVILMLYSAKVSSKDEPSFEQKENAIHWNKGTVEMIERAVKREFNNQVAALERKRKEDAQLSSIRLEGFSNYELKKIKTIALMTDQEQAVYGAWAHALRRIEKLEEAAIKVDLAEYLEWRYRPVITEVERMREIGRVNEKYNHR